MYSDHTSLCSAPEVTKCRCICLSSLAADRPLLDEDQLRYFLPVLGIYPDHALQLFTWRYNRGFCPARLGLRDGVQSSRCKRQCL